MQKWIDNNELSVIIFLSTAELFMVKGIIYSDVDDFSGDYLIGPTYLKESTNVIGGFDK